MYTDVHYRKLPQRDTGMRRKLQTISVDAEIRAKDATRILRELVLGTLCAVQRTAALSLGNACGIEGAADDVVTNAGEIPYTAAADENGRVLLKVVAFAGDVDGTFLLVGKSYSGNLTDSRVGLFRRGCGDRNANAALLGAVVEDGRLALVYLLFPAVLDELIDCRHDVPPCFTRSEETCGIYL